MNKRLFIALVLALTLVALAVTSTLAGDIIRFSGRFAEAFFFSTDGCIAVFVGVFANDGTFQAPPGPGSSSSGAGIFINEFNFCTGSSVFFSGFATLADADFRVSRDLTSATLNTTIPVEVFVCDEFGCTFVGTDVVDVDQTWTGTGTLSRGNSHFHSSSPNCIVNGHSNGSSRPAEASGSVTIAATDFTPNPTDSAFLSSTKDGTVQIGCEF